MVWVLGYTIWYSPKVLLRIKKSVGEDRWPAGRKSWLRLVGLPWRCLARPPALPRPSSPSPRLSADLNWSHKLCYLLCVTLLWWRPKIPPIFPGRYGDLDASLISYGPCQTPTLGFCVQRHDEIQTFKAEAYWVLRVAVITTAGKELPLEWKRIRCFDKDIANMFLASIKEFKEATWVLSVLI